MRREKASLPVDVRRSKTSLLKFPNFAHASRFLEHFFAVVARLRRETF